jgi:pimeloyl-ACP methyl ester carboxylesterase
MIFVLPGMGADAGMFTGSWRHLPEAVFANWPTYAGEDSLAEIAQRIVATYAIPDGAVVIGTSLGGMVACEIARIIRLRRLVLIGSATHPSEINSLLTSLQPLHRVAPIGWLQWSATSFPGEIARAFSQSETAFIRSAIGAIFKWDGLHASLPRPLRIHGRYDTVIPPPDEADLFVDGGHLIAMTHSHACCEFITQALLNDSAKL